MRNIVFKDRSRINFNDAQDRQMETKMNDATRLKNIFDLVRKTIFTQWDRVSEWIVIHDSELPSQGRCWPEEKKITVRFVSKNDDDLKLLLIHEICHSSALGHDKKWFSRMLKASSRAKKAGWLNVADMIKKEVKGYQAGAVITKSTVYARIHDALLDCPDASYESIKNSLAYDLGIYPKEFEETYKQARKVYETAYRQRQKMMKAEREFRERLENMKSSE